MNRIIALSICLMALAAAATAQVAQGGTYTLEQSVIAGGGGTSSGGTFSITGTTGQSAAGASSTGGTFNVKGGFWTPGPFAPTAAGVSISGRVVDIDGSPLANISIRLSNGSEMIRFAQTDQLGEFHIDDVEVGRTYLVFAKGRRFTFTAQVVSVQDEISGLVFTGLR